MFDAMKTNDVVQMSAAIAAGFVLLAYLFLVAAPAWSAYGRAWEKVGALFLSVYVLAGMLALGALAGMGAFLFIGR